MSPQENNSVDSHTASAGAGLGLTGADEAKIRAYLERLYAGVLTPQAVEAHMRDWVGRPAAEWELGVVKPLVPNGGQILDIGCGFGSFVVLARQAGYDASGLDLAPYEIEMARKRLRGLSRDDEPTEIFRVLDAMRLDPQEEQFDAITLWNILEHVPDYRALLRSVYGLLKPEGRIFLICPNYFAWRLEAHYHVPWSPRLYFSRKAARRHLEKLGKDPVYFDSGIHYTTNWGVLRTLWGLRLNVFNIDGTLPLSPGGWSVRLLARHWKLIGRYLNPLAESAVLMAQKPNGEQS